MSNKTVIGLIVGSALFASSASYADHMSIWGEGFANMPNDIHNTRIEEDDETFMDLVQYGDGADSENRYADDSDNTIDSDSTTGSSMAVRTAPRSSTRTTTSRASVSRMRR